jgi:transposase
MPEVTRPHPLYRVALCELRKDEVRPWIRTTSSAKEASASGGGIFSRIRQESTMAQKSKTYTPKFKFQLVLEVLQGERSDVKIGRIYGVHHTTISKWKRQFLEHGAEVFGGNKEIER